MQGRGNVSDLTCGSLFSGIGGFDLGFEQAGIETIWQVEIDKKCNKVLARHWPDVRRYKDVRDVGKQNLSAVDIICGGFPCQDVSVAGKRKGLSRGRSGLWFEFSRIIKELSPQWIIIENVPGLLLSNRGRDFAVILQELVKLRYGVCWRVLDAKYFGVPQRRRRVFIIGSLGNGRSAQVLFESESSARDIVSGKQERGDYIKSPKKDSREESKPISFYVSAGNRSLWESILVSPTLRTRSYSTGIACKDILRYLSPIEWERLQGFPDNWTDNHSDTARYKMLGNAVCVPVARWIGERIVKAS